MSETLRIAVPTDGEGGLDAERSGHFGRAESFTVVDVIDGVMSTQDVLVNGPHEHGGCGLVVQQLVSAGVGAVIAAGMGGGPRAGFASAGIPVYFDQDSATPRAAIEAYLAGGRESFGDDHQCAGH